MWTNNPRKRPIDCIRSKGIVTCYDVDASYGTILGTDGSGNEFHVHWTDIRLPEGIPRSLDEGEEVEFDEVLDKASGIRKATNVTGPDGRNVRGKKNWHDIEMAKARDKELKSYEYERERARWFEAMETYWD